MQSTTSNITVDASFDRSLNQFGFVTVILCILTGFSAALLPLDAPAGANATDTERLAWLAENMGSFVAGWVNQIIAMLSLSGFFLAIALRARHVAPLRVILAVGAVAMATMAFAIPKFMAIWTIPMLTEASVTGGSGSEMAETLLPLLNVSIPFSLYTSFDYLGFWLYALFAVLMMGAVDRIDKLSTITAASLGLFGLGFHVALMLLLTGVIGAADIEMVFGITFIPLLFLLLVMLAIFRRDRTPLGG
ncbi:hypothetical protein E0F26_01095 [Candidatus Paraluminiphilus aquimaris]|uniref:DUF4386 domain-containing protein n=1 Tax=Candidatus Paraluminiphilus aquimaris TaxID=2518994 RepID=A0ABY6Q2M4_9GAMM|nr:hypothetical protein [Candidatus Paraluminiphilus aquimaris]UZP73414.1 hypothetical protein E0F26_01095 [Candidatus Paraluminiphilus aquimaris]